MSPASDVQKEQAWKGLLSGLSFFDLIGILIVGGLLNYGAAMSLSVRYYLFPETSEPMRLSQRLVNGLISGRDAMPPYAGTRQRVMGVVLDNKDGKPHKIDRTYGTIWTFDTDGHITEGLREGMAHAMNSIDLMPTADSTVVPLRPSLSRKKLDDDFRWEPTNGDITRIILDIWPKSKADRLLEAKGVSPKRPPLTRDARFAIGEASQDFWKIAHQIERLKEPGLKGFAFEARRRAKEDPQYRHLYLGLASMAEDHLELVRRRKSGKGVWYAVIEVMIQREDYMETARVIHEQCDGRKAAVIAARSLLAENAALFNEYTSVETRVITDLEWETEGLAQGADSPGNGL
jgi:hypothetical protein